MEHKFNTYDREIDIDFSGKDKTPVRESLPYYAIARRALSGASQEEQNYASETALKQFRAIKAAQASLATNFNCKVIYDYGEYHNAHNLIVISAETIENLPGSWNGYPVSQRKKI